MREIKKTKKRRRKLMEREKKKKGKKSETRRMSKKRRGKKKARKKIKSKKRGKAKKQKRSNPLILIVLDGWGIDKDKKGNAIELGNTPNYHHYFKKFPSTTLKASGEAVGLPKGYMGNSEVGHLHLGAGRIVPQDLTRINQAIKDKSFFKNPALLGAIEHVKKNKSALHLMGMVSDAGVHSHINHLFALLKLAKENNLSRVYIHSFTDGRDTGVHDGLSFIKKVYKKTRRLRVGKITTIIGRYYAMDRDERWRREKKAYDAMVKGIGLRSKTPEQAVKEAYQRGETDEFITPIVLERECTIENDDAIIFFNFRTDRARQITEAIIAKNFRKFKRGPTLKNIYFVGLTHYDDKFDKCPYFHTAFPPLEIKNTLGEYLSQIGKKQLRIAETEKWAHVTFFFNGLSGKIYKKEERILIHSPHVPTYDLKPEMSAEKITAKAVNEIKKKKYDFILMNFANGDMVGHTGSMPATLKAVETVDHCLKRVVESAIQAGMTSIVTADHGNAEKMLYSNNEPCTTHTTNKVPFIVIGKECKMSSGEINQAAPTVLQLMGLKKPKEMKAKSLNRK